MTTTKRKFNKSYNSITSYEGTERSLLKVSKLFSSIKINGEISLHLVKGKCLVILVSEEKEGEELVYTMDSTLSKNDFLKIKANCHIVIVPLWLNTSYFVIDGDIEASDDFYEEIDLGVKIVKGKREIFIKNDFLVDQLKRSNMGLIHVL